ncbi:beta-adaptin [Polyrhizophydium stewartii]|uniref:AP complex subunit beta n=1 Tax=Polyrhizophydium stewartii TaxID=2732419 RepID=A0ABR4NET9_9FUNG
MATAPRFFATNKKGENFELKADLNSEYRDKRKETVKKVIANMTIGKDVSSLFADVVKNMQTEDLELKKLVYLYLINYAKSQPELVILAVNTFVKRVLLTNSSRISIQDSDDPNPLIRALAIRTMGCLRVEKIVDYLLEPLKKGLKDEDPYVRKTAALCVAKLFDLNPGIAIDNGLIAILQDMLSDRNPMVIANAVSALQEISEASVQKDIFVINDALLQKLLAALNECTEWGQICILNSLSGYRPRDVREAADIIERVVPRLQHVNASVVLSAVKVLMIYLSHSFSDELDGTIVRKLAPPLVTLISSEPEIQYVVLRNINLILQKRPDVLTQEIRVFFTKYNDPPYVKLEKLEVVIKLCSEANVDQVLSELKEYANEVDVDFVRKSVRAIGRCAIKIPAASDKCVHALLDLIKTGINYIVQESIVVIKDIFRKYPHKYEGIIPALCQNLESLDEPDAKSSLIWIIGEYADRIENASELLEHFLENFKDEASKVQLQLITATVKLFLKRPGSAQDIVQRVLQGASQANDNPDIRDRAYVYRRLLLSNPQVAKAVVLAEKPPIELETGTVSESLLDELITNISSLASVYHKSPALLGGSSFVDMSQYRQEFADGDDEPEARRSIVQEAAQAMGASGGVDNLLDLDFGTPAAQPAPVGGGLGGLDMRIGGPATAAAPASKSGIDDLLSLDMGMGTAMPSLGGVAGVSVAPLGGLGGFSFGGSNTSPIMSSPPGSARISLPKTPFLQPASSQGLDLSGTFARRGGSIMLDLTIANRGTGPMSGFAIQFNVNTFGISPTAPLTVPEPVAVGASVNVSVPLGTSGGVQKMDPANTIQIAVKNNFGVYYFQTQIPVHLVLVDASAADATAASFGGLWGDFTAASASFAVLGAPFGDAANKLRANGLHVVQQSPSSVQAFGKTSNGVPVAIEVTPSGGGVNVSGRSRSPEILSLLQTSLEVLLR